MITCQDLDRLTTPFIDGLCSEVEHTAILAHLQKCQSCQARVQAESTASRLLQAQAAAARAMGVPPPWRPRVVRLGRPTLPMHGAWLLPLALAGAALAGWALRPSTVMAVGVIGDSFCEHHHRFSARFNVGDRECTLGCVKGGAEYVLVTDTDVYRFHDPQLAELQAFANLRVKVEGTMEGDRIRVAEMTLVNDAAP